MHLNWACGPLFMLFLVLLHGRILFLVEPSCYVVVSLSRRFLLQLLAVAGFQMGGLRFLSLAALVCRGCCSALGLLWSSLGVLAAPRSRRGCLHSSLVIGASVCELAGTVAFAVTALAEKLGQSHTPANAIWPVSKTGQMPLFGLRVAVGVPGGISCWRGCRSEAWGRHP